MISLHLKYNIVYSVCTWSTILELQVLYFVLLAIQSYTMVYIFTISFFYKVKMFMFYNVQTTSSTFVDLKKMRYTLV